MLLIFCQKMCIYSLMKVLRYFSCNNWIQNDTRNCYLCNCDIWSVPRSCHVVVITTYLHCKTKFLSPCEKRLHCLVTLATTWTHSSSTQNYCSVILRTIRFHWWAEKVPLFPPTPVLLSTGFVALSTIQIYISYSHTDALYTSLCGSWGFVFGVLHLLRKWKHMKHSHSFPLKFIQFFGQ